MKLLAAAAVALGLSLNGDDRVAGRCRWRGPTGPPRLTPSVVAGGLPVRAGTAAPMAAARPNVQLSARLALRSLRPPFASATGKSFARGGDRGFLDPRP